ncbi:hypothetical protein FQA39_LY10371 [Lamprigera yunnana]|nr:hypothetical protein FQA39_LY10371 [Lamprigera yunnana]
MTYQTDETYKCVDVGSWVIAYSFVLVSGLKNLTGAQKSVCWPEIEDTDITTLVKVEMVLPQPIADRRSNLLPFDIESSGINLC